MGQFITSHFFIDSFSSGIMELKKNSKWHLLFNLIIYVILNSAQPVIKVIKNTIKKNKVQPFSWIWTQRLIEIKDNTV